MTDVLGTDLQVVPAAPAMSAHDASPLDLVLGAGDIDRGLDAPARLSGHANLGQAITLRLLTPRGALAGLGHAQYGSRIHELVGERKTEATRALLKAYVLEAVAQEPRIEPSAVAFVFDLPSEGPSEVRFTLTVAPVDGSAPVTVDLGVTV
jgi:phage baseplate assembly protein W